MGKLIDLKPNQAVTSESSPEPSKPRVKMGEVGPDAEVERLYAQYRAYLNRRSTETGGTKFDFIQVTFLDYVLIRKSVETIERNVNPN